MQGFDVASPVGSQAGQIKAAGYGFVGRYFSFNPAKNLSAGEVRKLCAAGLAIVTVFEAAGDVYTSFDEAHGKRDAQQALTLASSVGQPEGSVIYFAVDFDAIPIQIHSGIAAYFDAVGKALSGKYRVGVYGSGAVCRSLKEWGYAEFHWLACASGWAETKTFAGAHIVQQMPTKVLGLNVDPDISVDGDFGQWMLPVNEAEDPLVAKCKELQQGLADAGFDPGPADGFPGTRTFSAMARYRKARGV